MRIERDSPPRWPRLGLLGASLCLVVAGCSQSTEGSVESGSAQAVEAPAEEGLPLLPPADERQPELFDERGCLITGSDDADCTTTADEVDAGAAGGSTTDERSLEGFLGTSWVESPVGTGPVVLGETVVAGPGADGRWQARGLARNEGPAAVAGVEVEAVLVGADGAELGRARATSPVAGVRSGEPVPFEVVAEVAAADVAEVVWSAVPADGAAVGRELELSIWWVRTAGDPRPVDSYAYTDSGDARPQVLFGGVVNRSAAPIARPRAVVAWQAPDGRVLSVDEAPVVDPQGRPLAELPPGGAADVLVVVDDPGVDPAIADAIPLLWGLAG